MKPYKFKTISEYHQFRGLPEPEHPLVSVINFESISQIRDDDIAQSLHVSPNYLSGLLKVVTGQSTKQHIHDKLIEKAKEKLSVTELSVSEIAYELGFEHSQSFSKLFKSKTSLTPIEYRNSYN